MVDVGDITAWGALTGAAVALAFAVVVWRANSRGRRNRHLAALLVAESLFQGTLILSFWSTNKYLEVVGQWIALTILSAAFLLFATTLEGRFARALANRPTRVGIVLVCLGSLALCLWSARNILAAGGGAAELEDQIGWPWPVFAGASVLSLVVSVNAYTSTAPGSALRRKALAYALAFGIRDALYAGVVIWWSVAAFVFHSESVAEAGAVVGSVTTILFVGFLAYGILSTQLFDIDLKIKMGISRGTVASLALAVVFVISKLVEAYASRNLGFVAGGVAAGLLLFAAPRLNKLGDRVANTAMPAVQPTSEYLAYKKLEVYRAAVESAIEGDRAIDTAERAMLDRLRTKLGLREDDARALEAEVAGSTA